MLSESNFIHVSNKGNEVKISDVKAQDDEILLTLSNKIIYWRAQETVLILFQILKQWFQEQYHYCNDIEEKCVCLN